MFCGYMTYLAPGVYGPVGDLFIEEPDDWSALDLLSSQRIRKFSFPKLKVESSFFDIQTRSKIQAR